MMKVKFLMKKKRVRTCVSASSLSHTVPRSCSIPRCFVSSVVIATVSVVGMILGIPRSCVQSPMGKCRIFCIPTVAHCGLLPLHNSQVEGSPLLMKTTLSTYVEHDIDAARPTCVFRARGRRSSRLAFVAFTTCLRCRKITNLSSCT